MLARVRPFRFRVHSSAAHEPGYRSCVLTRDKPTDEKGCVMNKCIHQMLFNRLSLTSGIGVNICSWKSVKYHIPLHFRRCSADSHARVLVTGRHFLFVVLVLMRETGESRLVGGGGVSVSRSHMSFYLRTGWGATHVSFYLHIRVNISRLLILQSLH